MFIAVVISVSFFSICITDSLLKAFQLNGRLHLYYIADVRIRLKATTSVASPNYLINVPCCSM
mgnify:FL=1